MECPHVIGSFAPEWPVGVVVTPIEDVWQVSLAAHEDAPRGIKSVGLWCAVIVRIRLSWDSALAFRAVQAVPSRLPQALLVVPAMKSMQLGAAR